MVYYHGSLYLFGGTTVDLTSDNRLYKYDIAAQTWSVVATTNSALSRYLLGSCLIGSKFYLLTG
jgi:hypothetical protein